ncbi:hypothetical protein [Pseudodesulfovibrio sediminis]|uniref:Uncharacterized protein n=1 Tax=Pseudodesulfovibrio sediminis TaxID=2810563 RepID=A0ABN6ESE0_9BACT|nr:hypothetical protein [Pseudodesulfovibrio sediminis]BCS88150.1 hypothetical protein PSDVSF_13920 [Pseudodesulfovibrio sediminis]
MIFAGIEALRLGEVFGGARRRIILYAPPYGNFAANESVRQGLETALSRCGGTSLMACCLPLLSDDAWTREVMGLLRPQAGVEVIEKELAASRHFLHELQSLFGDRVELIEMPFRPSLPALIVDDSVYFGHFAHSPVLTPDGFWCVADVPVEALFAMARTGRVPEKTAREERAAFRIIAECAQALERGKRLDAKTVA